MKKKSTDFPFGQTLLSASHPALENWDQLLEVMHGIGAKPFMAQYQQKPYPPGEGEGLPVQPRFFERIEVEEPGGLNLILSVIGAPQEEKVEAELFNGTDYTPFVGSGLRLITDNNTKNNEQGSHPSPCEDVED